MTFKSLIITILVASAPLFAMAAKPASARSAHEAMHRTQLANVNKSKMDASVIDGFLKEDIIRRESAAAEVLSSETNTMLNDLLTEAKRHIGKPYRSGSKGPSAFDCSGFSSYVYKQFGYSISPASRAQYGEGVKIDRKNLRKGDLVFFTSRRSGNNVGHVGIVVSADNKTGDFKFIHASIKGIKIDDCKGYYEGRYVGARRIIND